jgi:hypothetical protein
MTKKREPETLTWNEVCKRVRMGDGLYSTCREKVPEYGAGGFRGGLLDEVPDRQVYASGPAQARPARPAKGRSTKKTEDAEDAEETDDFENALSKTTLKIPTPPSKGKLAKRPPDQSPEPEFMGMPLERILMYGGIAMLAWFFLGRKSQIIIGTETAAPAAPAAPRVTSPKAA